MGILIRKEKGLVSTTISRLAIISLIASLSYSLIDTIWAIYINSYVQSVVFVGLLSAILTLISFISYFLFIPIIEKKDKSRIYSFSLLIFALSYILFALNTKFYFFIIISFILVVFQTLRITSFGIIVRDKSYERYLSRNEGLMYAFTNVAWVIGPLISGFISEKYGIRIVFVLAAIFVLIAFFLFKISNIKTKKQRKK